MSRFFDPTPQQARQLEEIAAAIPGVQKTFVDNHPHLTSADRAAHQQQIAASRVLLTIADRVPAELDGLGIFTRTEGTSEAVIGMSGARRRTRSPLRAEALDGAVGARRGSAVNGLARL